MAQTVQGGAFNLLPLSNAITEAKRYLQIQDTSDEDTLEILAWNAVRWFAPLSSFREQEVTVDVCDGKAILPNHCINFLWYSPVCNDTCTDDCTYVNDVFAGSCCNISIPIADRVLTTFATFNNGVIDFGCRTDFDQIKVWFLGYATDVDGVFKITDTTKVAVAWWVAGEYKLMKGDYQGYMIFNRKAIFAGNKIRSIDMNADFKQRSGAIGAMWGSYYRNRYTNGLTFGRLR